MEPTGDGTRLIDASSSGADAKIHFGRATAPLWTSGRVGAALALGGPAQETYAAASEYPQAEGDALSVVAWVYARARPRWASIAKNWAGGRRGSWPVPLRTLRRRRRARSAHGRRSRKGSGRARHNFPCRSTPGTTSPLSPMATELRLYRNGRQVASTALPQAASRPPHQGAGNRHQAESLRRCTGRARFQHVGRPPR